MSKRYTITRDQYYRAHRGYTYNLLPLWGGYLVLAIILELLFHPVVDMLFQQVALLLFPNWGGAFGALSVTFYLLLCLGNVFVSFVLAFITSVFIEVLR